MAAASGRVNGRTRAAGAGRAPRDTRDAHVARGQRGLAHEPVRPGAAGNGAAAAGNGKAASGERAAARARTRAKPVPEDATLPELRDALRASVGRYADLYNLAPVAIISIDGTGIIQQCNVAACALLGRGALDLLGTPLPALIARTDLQTMLEHLRLLRRGDRWAISEVRIRVRHADIVVQMHSAEEPSVDGTARWFQVALVDVTEQRRVEAALRRSEERYRGLVERASDLVCELDARGSIEFVNAAVLATLGYEEADLIGRAFTDFVPLWQRRRALRVALEARGWNGGAHYVELPLVTREGGEVWAGLNVVALPGPDRPGGYLVNGRDITAARLRARSADQVRELSAHLRAVVEEERARIARNVHDELGARLTAVKFAVAQARKAVMRNDDPRPALDDASAHAIAAMASVRQIASDLRPSVLDHLGLWPAIAWLADDFRARTGIACDVVHSGKPPQVAGDATATSMFRIVQESLTNVARHSGATKVCIRVAESRGHARIEIDDNGRGISADAIASARSLGLLGMRERAAQFGGDVRVARKAAGTTVSVRFPLRRSS